MLNRLALTYKEWGLELGATSLDRQFLLSTTVLVAALSAYGRRAYGDCVAGTPPTFTCSGANTTQQTITFDDATVSTVPGFSVVTADPRAVSITGDGALSYTDANDSTLTAADTALYIRSNGDVTGGNPGSITVDTNGALTGGNFGVDARNYGSGALSITANGDVTATSITGIYARNSSIGTDLGVTTGAGTIVTGRRDGIFARNYGMGALSVTANGDVTGTTSFGIYARNSGSDLDVTTGAGTNVAGAFNGIVAHNYGSGALSVTANGDVTGTNFDGIFVRNMTGTDLIVTTGAFSTVTGKDHGMNVRNYSGATTVTANGDVIGTAGTGIYAQNFAGTTDLTVTTGALSAVTGSSHGIYSRNYGSGDSLGHRQWRRHRHQFPRHLCAKLWHRPHRDRWPRLRDYRRPIRHTRAQLRRRRADRHRRWRCHRRQRRRHLRAAFCRRSD